MTLREFIKELNSIKPELMDKEVKIISENGLEMDISVKFVIEEKGNFEISKENVKYILISY